MIISIFNCSAGQVSDRDMQAAIRAVNIQVERDFAPYWSFGATLRLEGHTPSKGKKGRPYSPSDMRGDAILYLWDHVPRGYQGMHDDDFRGVPYGVVGLDLSAKLGDSWTTTLSHEALELIGDPESNLLVQGPNPKNPKKDVFHWFEMCDAVQAQWYEIEGIPVSDFVLPLYFTRDPQPAARTNFLGLYDKKTPPLKAFSVAPGGYVGFFNPATGKDDEFDAKDPAARRRRKIKSEFGVGRRIQRLRAGNF